jgi:hypothetical protein
MPGQNDRNQGEGNREAAKQYNKDTQEFVDREQVGERAQEAEDALEGKEGEALRKADEKGRAKAEELDPQVHRDPSKPTK